MPPPNGDVRPHAVDRTPENQRVTGAHGEAAPLWDMPIVELYVDVGAGDRDDSWGKRAQHQAPHGDLEPGRGVRVARQAVCRAKREEVHRARDRHPVALSTVPSQVLDGREQPGPDDFEEVQGYPLSRTVGT